MEQEEMTRRDMRHVRTGKLLRGDMGVGDATASLAKGDAKEEAGDSVSEEPGTSARN